MLNLEQASLRQLIIHRVGNQVLEDELSLSEEPVAMSEGALDLLGQALLNPFYKEDLLYNFYHESDVSLNAEYTFAKQFFSNDVEFIDFSSKTASSLFSKMINPKFKGGELWIALFSNVIVGDESVDAIGLFFLDRKKNFIRLHNNEKGYAIETDQGFDPSDPLTGCLICNTAEEQGFLLRIYGKTKGLDYKLWTDEFLLVKQNEDDYYKTQMAMHMCHDFVVEKMPEDFDIIRPDQADMLNKSYDYFKENDTFELEHYSNEILEQPEVQKSFNNYSQQYAREHDLNVDEEINVSDKAVKKLSRVFKSVIKLDKNFHVYVHGNRNNINRGYDKEKNLHFYQLYFKEEN